MTNLSSLTGFSSGGAGGGGDLPLVISQKMTLVDTANFISDPTDTSKTKQSSSTYQSFLPLAADGVFAGYFDPYNSSNQNASVRFNVFKVDPSNGSIGSLDSSQVWSHSHNETFSTCHFGAVGNMVMNCGHHRNPSYGSTYKGFCWAGAANAAGTVNSTAYGEGPWENWPHSNGGLVVGATGVGAGATMYARRSGYNTNNGQYSHNNHYFSFGGSVGRQEWSGGNSNTSTNYAWACAKQSKDDLTPGGMIMYYDNSGNQTASCIFGSSVGRGNASTTLGTKYWSSQEPCFHLSNGDYLFAFSGGTVIGDSSGNLTELSYNPVGVELLRMINTTERLQNVCAPCKEDDTWVVPFSSGVGHIKIHIDVNDQYKVTIQGHHYAFATHASMDVPTGGNNCYGFVGSNDEYFVRCYTRNARSTIYVYENPFAS
tara:strand:- start:5207 stop:6490 length:1284 start_codon:yes stop_codon:yes gene_type:complete